MTWVQVLLLVIAVGLTGWLVLSVRIRENRVAHDFCDRYLGVFQTYLNSRGTDMDAYTALTHDSSLIQEELGTYGIMSAQVLGTSLNKVGAFTGGLPFLRTLIGNDLLKSTSVGVEQIQGFGNGLQEILLRHIGRLEGEYAKQQADGRNPLSWLREGVRWYVALPVTLAQWSGLIGNARARQLQGGRVVSAVTFVVGLLAAVASVATIAGEWDALVRLWRWLLGLLH